jgi:hypothetical protein
MTATTRSPQSRPHSAPAYYLARPASVWITALDRQPRQHLASGCSDSGVVTVSPEP